MKYRIYVDEVGNPDLESSDDPNHRFLSLTGVILELSHVETVVHPQMEEIKARFFRSHPDDPVIFHRKEMLNARPPFEALKDEVCRQQFDAELLKLLATWDYTVITVCLDKKRHKENYTTWRYDPYHYCLAVLLERFAYFLGRHGSRGDVMAESRGGKEDMRLKKSFTRLWEQGTQYVEPTQFQERFTSRQLKIKTKANNIAGLQLCDLVAHSSRHEILWENGLVERPPAVFAEKIILVLQEKYDRRAGRILGKKLL
ncbi:MAG: DUF3800 domain-containing protein [Pirellulaceae bacterium]|nr:DUF3800 domain-containing protein [Pirellulaceae bacterium]